MDNWTDPIAFRLEIRFAKRHHPLYDSFMTYTAILTKDSDGGYVAQNPETGTTTQGDTVDEALANLREATELYLEEFPPESTPPALMTTFEVAHA